jgi:hypothetical protein|tara:strand:- start:723 stop:932 length:210 start_codon:yes stop_codon:yes gene_type:complete
MHYNIIYKDNKAYKIVTEVSIHNFQNRDGSVQQQVLGMYVHELNCDRVFQQKDKFLMCTLIPDVEYEEV